MNILEEIQGWDKGKLQLLIYALLDIDALTYNKVSVGTVQHNLDRCPHYCELTGTTPAVGVLSSSNAPVPDGRAKLLLTDYDRSFTAATGAIQRRQQAARGNYQFKRW